MKIGLGYDIHRFDAGRRMLKLGGITVPSDRGLGGHSDADVLLHAVADALLGAIGAPDLGELFPSSDPQYRGLDSRWFVEQACAMARRAGWQVANLDTTVVADAPRLVPHKTKMAASISRMLDIDPSQVCVKAKTTEGFPPGRDGIAAHAVVLLRAVGSRLKAQGKRKKRIRQPRALSQREALRSSLQPRAKRVEKSR